MGASVDLLAISIELTPSTTFGEEFILSEKKAVINKESVLNHQQLTGKPISWKKGVNEKSSVHSECTISSENIPRKDQTVSLFITALPR